DQIRIPIRTRTCRDLCALHLFTERTSADLPFHKGEPNTSSKAGSVRGNRLLPFGLAWCCRCNRCNTLARTHTFGASCLSWSSGRAHLLVVALRCTFPRRTSLRPGHCVWSVCAT